MCVIKRFERIVKNVKLMNSGSQRLTLVLGEVPEVKKEMSGGGARGARL